MYLRKSTIEGLKVKHYQTVSHAKYYNQLTNAACKTLRHFTKYFFSNEPLATFGVRKPLQSKTFVYVFFLPDLGSYHVAQLLQDCMGGLRNLVLAYEELLGWIHFPVESRALSLTSSQKIPQFC